MPSFQSTKSSRYQFPGENWPKFVTEIGLFHAVKRCLGKSCSIKQEIVGFCRPQGGAFVQRKPKLAAYAPKGNFEILENCPPPFIPQDNLNNCSLLAAVKEKNTLMWEKKISACHRQLSSFLLFLLKSKYFLHLITYLCL